MKAHHQSGFSLCFLPFALACCCSAAFSLPAFPGAQGWGAETKGGRGGKIYVVTTLDSMGPGSFNEAFRKAEPRFIVFRVSGVINMSPNIPGEYYQWYLTNKESFITVAGQTSPGGVTMVSGTGGSNAIFCYPCDFQEGIFRHLRFRSGDHNDGAVTFGYGTGAHHLMFDHCSFSGGSDETFDLVGSRNYTVQWCNVTNPSSGQLNNMLIGVEPASFITLHHVLFAHATYRMPHANWTTGPADKGMIDYRNNVCYNSATYTFNIGTSQLPMHINMVGNYIKAGPQTDVYPTASWGEYVYKSVSLSNSFVYDSGNGFKGITEAYNCCNVLDSLGRYTARMDTPWVMPPVTTHSATEALDLVLDRSGAWPRDAMDIRTAAEVRAGSGQFGKDDDAKIATGPQPPADADLDGMPDFWETGMGLNPNLASDNLGDKDGDGYTNIEEYVNDLAAARLCEDYYNPVYPVPSNWPDYNPSCAKNVAVEAAVPRGDPADAWVPGLSIAPNPVGRVVSFQLSVLSHERGALTVHDAGGRVIHKFPLAPGGGMRSFTLDVSAFPAGIYLVQARVRNTKSVQKFLVTR